MTGENTHPQRKVSHTRDVNDCAFGDCDGTEGSGDDGGEADSALWRRASEGCQPLLGPGRERILKRTVDVH